MFAFSPMTQILLYPLDYGFIALNGLCEEPCFDFLLSRMLLFISQSLSSNKSHVTRTLHRQTSHMCHCGLVILLIIIHCWHPFLCFCFPSTPVPFSIVVACPDTSGGWCSPGRNSVHAQQSIIACLLKWKQNLHERRNEDVSGVAILKLFTILTMNHMPLRRLHNFQVILYNSNNHPCA